MNAICPRYLLSYNKFTKTFSFWIWVLENSKSVFKIDNNIFKREDDNMSFYTVNYLNNNIPQKIIDSANYRSGPWYSITREEYTYLTKNPEKSFILINEVIKKITSFSFFKEIFKVELNYLMFWTKLDEKENIFEEESEDSLKGEIEKIFGYIEIFSYSIYHKDLKDKLSLFKKINNIKNPSSLIKGFEYKFINIILDCLKNKSIDKLNLIYQELNLKDYKDFENIFKNKNFVTEWVESRLTIQEKLSIQNIKFIDRVYKYKDLYFVWKVYKSSWETFIDAVLCEKWIDFIKEFHQDDYQEQIKKSFFQKVSYKVYRSSMCFMFNNFTYLYWEKVLLKFWFHFSNHTKKDEILLIEESESFQIKDIDKIINKSFITEITSESTLVDVLKNTLSSDLFNYEFQTLNKIKINWLINNYWLSYDEIYLLYKYYDLYYSNLITWMNETLDERTFISILSKIPYYKLEDFYDLTWQLYFLFKDWDILKNWMNDFQVKNNIFLFKNNDKIIHFLNLMDKIDIDIRWKYKLWVLKINQNEFHTYLKDISPMNSNLKRENKPISILLSWSNLVQINPVTIWTLSLWDWKFIESYPFHFIPF